MDDAGVLPRRQVWLSPETAWEQILALASAEGGEPLADGRTGLLRNLELHRPASLLLNDGRAIANSPASKHVIDPQPDEISAPKSAVDRQIEHRKIASATLHLRPYSNGPDILWLQRPFLSDQPSPVPRCTPAGGNRVVSRHRHLRCRPLPAQRQIDIDRLREPRPERARGPDPRPSHPSRMGKFDPKRLLPKTTGFRR